MTAAAAPDRPLFWLDALRAGAAGLVLLSHARDMLVRDAAAGPALSWPGQAFMAVSGLGHQAVIVFFVLSGTLVTAGMLRAEAAGRWSLPAFAAARLTRLWVVLVPCLVLGGALDALGLALHGPGDPAPYGIPPLSGPAAPPALGPEVALGNLAFLQTVAVPVYGSNGPLWSLANEAWYYALAALLFAAWRQRARPAAAALPLAAAILVAAILPGAMLRLAPVWGMGAVVALVRTRERTSRPAGFGSLPALLGVAVALAASRLRLGPMPALDLALGAATALLVVRLQALPEPRPGRLADATRGLSRLSYSLYLSHCPVLALFAAVAVGGVRLPFGPEALGLVACGMALAVAVAAGVWWGFERHTGRVRDAVLRLGARPGLAAPVVAAEAAS